MPAWIWPIVVVGIAGFFIFHAIQTSEAVAKVFGKLGLRAHEKATRLRRILAHTERIEEILEGTNDKLECATAYLVLDADWHRETNMILAENYPNMAKVLPARLPYTVFAKRWREGWRPGAGDEWK
jgi:hypothetical protein